MRVHTVDHKRSDAEVYNKTHYLHGRLPERPLCWLLGHKPVVFTYESKYTDDVRWIECKRCWRRPVTQSNYKVGPGEPINWIGMLQAAKEQHWSHRNIDSRVQVVLRKPAPELSLKLHFGGRGSETPIDAHCTFLGSGWYLGLGIFAKLAERLGPQRDLKFAIHHGSAYWCLWKDDSEGSSDTPRWRQGSVSVNPLDHLFGPKRYSYEDVSTSVHAVTFAEGDSCEVKFTLQRQSHGRKKLPRFAKKGWSVDWDAKGGIPVYVDRDWKGNEVYGSGFQIDDEAAALPESDRHYSWVDEAQAKLVEWVTTERTKNRWKAGVSS